MKKLCIISLILWNIGLLLLTGNVYQRNKNYNKQIEYQLASLESAVATALYLQKNKESLSHLEQEGLWAYIENTFHGVKQ